MSDTERYPFLPLPEAFTVPLRKSGGGGGVSNPKKARQLERLGPQFHELQRALQRRSAQLSESALGVAPEHVLVFETNGLPQKFYEAVRAAPDLEWLLELEERVEEDGDFRKKRAQAREGVPPGEVSKCVYMVFFNQTAVDQLLSAWAMYAKGKMPVGLGHWSDVFRCLRSIRRWGPEDRLREAGLLGEALTGLTRDAMVPVEIELWPRASEVGARAEQEVEAEVRKLGGAVRHRCRIDEIHYHALLVELPHEQVARLLLRRDVDLLLIDNIYLMRGAPQASVSAPVSDPIRDADTLLPVVQGVPVVALLDGLPNGEPPLAPR